jgi:hypothetical protein
MIVKLTPQRGPVLGGSLVTITHTGLLNIGDLEDQIGQSYVSLTRVSEVEMTMVTPKQTVQGDATWVVPGSEPVKIFRVGVTDPLTGTKKRVLYSQDTLYFFLGALTVR